MQQKMYQIDAFTDKVFSGNPAAVCPLDNWLDDETMQSIALENNLSETAFFVKEDEVYHLRWFTPLSEVDMCGHATLASAYVLFECLNFKSEEILFKTKSGELKVWKENNKFVMEFPILALSESDIFEEIEEAFGMKPNCIFSSMDYIVIFDNEEDIYNANPNLESLKKLDLRGVCISAKSNRYDFITRFFAPKYGIDEDPVTGSAFTQLVSYWDEALSTNEFYAKQVSSRSGEIWCEIKENRVFLKGDAVKYLEGTITI